MLLRRCSFRYICAVLAVSTFLFAADLFPADTSKAPIAKGPCLCESDGYRAHLTLSVADRDVRGDRAAALRAEEERGAIRLAFALAFCGKPPTPFEKTGDTRLRWPEAKCEARSRSPRPWPELVEVSCEGAWPALPAGFALEPGPEWHETGEELNRRWERTLTVSRVASECSHPEKNSK